MKPTITLSAAILAIFTLASCSKIMDKTSEANSQTNLRILHTALDAYLTDNDSWPQVPEELKGAHDVKYFDWWKNTLRPYGMEDENWYHPNDKASRKAGTGSYLPTLFDANTFTPLRWNKPWVSEREDFGEGKLLLFPDGSIRNEADYLEEQKRKKEKKVDEAP